ncbi:hypothetical protein ACQB60_04235 [Actinomycetota bacterium Odt1-20B]
MPETPRTPSRWSLPTSRLADSPRLLPWTGPEGKPAYLLTDGSGPVSRLADTMEAVHLGIGGDLLDHSRSMLAEHDLSAAELRYLADRLTESLHEVVRVAESRGARLISQAHDTA